MDPRRLEDIILFYSVLEKLEDSVGVARKLSDQNHVEHTYDWDFLGVPGALVAERSVA